MTHLTNFLFFERLEFEILYFIPSDIDMKKINLQRLRFWIEKYTTWIEKLYNVSDVAVKNLQHVRLLNKVFAACQFSKK